MKQFYSSIKPYWREMLLSPFLKLVEAVLELLVPLILAGLIDQALLGQDWRSFLPSLLGLVCLAVLGVLVAITAQYYAAKASVYTVKRLTETLFEHISFLPAQSRTQLTNQSLLTNLTADTLQIQSGLNLFLRLFLRAPIIVFGAVIMAFSISPSLTTIFLVMVVALFGMIYGLSRYAQPTYHELKHQQESLVERLDEQLSGLRLIRAFNQGQREQADFTQLNQVYRQVAIKAANRSILINPATYLIVNLALLILLWQGRLTVLTGAIGAGSLVALVNYLLQILQELLKLTTMISSMNQSWVSLKRIDKVFAYQREDLKKIVSSNKIKASLGKESLAVLEVRPDDLTLDNFDFGRGLEQEEADFAYQLEHVSLTYHQAEEAVLQDLNLTIPRGSSLAITGSTGSGKSSLLALLAGLFQPSQGQVKLGQWSGQEATLTNWRQQISYLAQKNNLLSGRVRDYLTLGLTEAVSDQDIWWALELAQAKDFISQRHGKLDAEIKPYGQNFSGGQRQRLNIARSLLARRQIMIWDDATSALDYVTESKILAGLRKELPEVTLIMVSQRMKTLQAADRILVLEQGKLAGLGSHDQLLVTSDLYRQLFASQEGKEADNA